MPSTILIVDDNAKNLQVLAGMLEPLGCEILVARDGEQALSAANLQVPDLVLLDVNMPDLDGFEVCRRLKSSPSTEDVPVIFLTARTDPEDVMEGFEAGGVDYVTKPFNERELKARVDTQIKLRSLISELQKSNDDLRTEIARRQALAVERDQLADRLSAITEEEEEHWGIRGFIGQSTTLSSILDEIRRLQVAGSTSVLITGESGTGKELVARAIHFGSDRDGPFVPVNCSAVPGELADSLFFGHVKGAFTGADRDRQGYFEQASGGSLFLDELGEMPSDLQAKLLRVLETRKVMPVGTSEERDVDCRILSATNVDLATAVQEGRFRQDLYYRLAGYPVHVPPLRERKEDIPLLTDHFVRLLAEDIGIRDASVTAEAVNTLTAHLFPGNIRELKNVIERALIASGGRIDASHLHLAGDLTAQSSGEHNRLAADDLPLNLEQAEILLMQRALARTGGNMQEAAKLLGTSRSTLYRRISAADSIGQ